MIESEVYKLSAGAYMRQLFPLYLKRRWWLFVLVALPFPVLALWNLNFLYAALMVEFFVIPMMLGLAYFYYALSEECVSSIRRCRVRIGEGGIEREFVDGENAVISVKKTGWEAFCRCDVADAGIKLFHAGKAMAFDFIPSSAFSEEKYLLATALINNALPNGDESQRKNVCTLNIFCLPLQSQRRNGSLDEWLSQRSAKPCTAVRFRHEPLKRLLDKGSLFFILY